MRPLKKILHIDDDAVMRMMVQKSLERSGKGFETISCATVEDFMEKLSSFIPDLLVIDVVMPIIDGPELLSKIRRLGNRIPAIFMTGQENIEFKDRGKLEPIIGIIHKPFSPALLGEDLLNLWKNKS